MSKSLLIGAVKSATPDIGEGLAEAVVDQNVVEIVADLTKHRTALHSAVHRAVPTMSLEQVEEVTAEVLKTIEVGLASRKPAMAKSVLKLIPGARDNVANRIVDSFLATIGDELVTQGYFTFQKIGSISMKPKARGAANDDASHDGDEPEEGRRAAGVATTFQVSRYVMERWRAAVAQHEAAVAGVAQNDAGLAAQGA